MANLNTIARPYAKAIFEIALKEKKLQEWSNVLTMLAPITENSDFQALLKNPVFSSQQIAELLFKISPIPLGAEAKNLIHLLSNKKRLSLLSYITKLFETTKADHERTLEVKVVTAFAMDPVKLTKLQNALQVYLNRQITINLVIDNTLLGGVVIYAGSKVINASIRGRFNQLSERLCS